jgi:phosphatidylglycerol:prolipoprotein diacylglycerol transferase
MISHLLFIHWNPNPDFLHFGTFAIKWYGVFWGLSLFSCFFLLQYIFKKLGRDDEKITLGIQYVFIGGLIGARLAHIIFYQLDFYLAHPQDILAVWIGGLASHGGVVGAFVGMYLFCRRNKEFTLLWVFDHAVAASLLLAALIRLGNLMNSELYGTPTNVPWAFIFEQVDNIPRHPVVLYESIAYFIIQVIMIFLFNRIKDSRPGIYLAVFFTASFTARFFLEFYKVPEGHVFLGFISKTQLLNIPFILTGLVFFYLSLSRRLHYKAAPSYAEV